MYMYTGVPVIGKDTCYNILVCTIIMVNSNPYGFKIIKTVCMQYLLSNLKASLYYVSYSCILHNRLQYLLGIARILWSALDHILE